MHVSRSYSQNKSGTFFLRHGVLCRGCSRILANLKNRFYNDSFFHLPRKLSPWEEDFLLKDLGKMGLFAEYSKWVCNSITFVHLASDLYDKNRP